jgi:GT2 family glycosyltransferase
MKSISVVMPVLDEWELTQNALLSLVDSEVLSEIVIINNSSNLTCKTGLQEFERIYPARLNIISNDSNVGVATAFNQGIRVAKSDRILFLNNDLLFDDFDQVCNNLLLILEGDSKLGAIMPVLVTGEGKIDSVGGWYSSLGFLYYPFLRQRWLNQFEGTVYPHSLKGAFMLWKRECIEMIGGFDDEYFAYFEESEACLRAAAFDWRVACSSVSVVVHLGSRSGAEWRRRHLTETAVRNHLWLIRTYASLRQRFLMIPTLILGYFLRSIWLGVKSPSVISRTLVGTSRGLRTKDVDRRIGRQTTIPTVPVSLTYLISGLVRSRGYGSSELPQQ